MNALFLAFAVARQPDNCGMFVFDVRRLTSPIFGYHNNVYVGLVGHRSFTCVALQCQYRLRTGASAQPERAYVQRIHQRMHARSCSEIANCDADGVWCRMAVAALLRYPSSYYVRRV